MQLMEERSSCLNFNQRASECAATGDTKHLSVMKPCIHSLSSLRKTLVAPCLLIYLSSPSLATFNTGAMETRGENRITALKWRREALICECLLLCAFNFIRAVVYSAWFESWLTYKHHTHTHTHTHTVSGINDSCSARSLVYFIFQLCFWRSSRQLFKCKYSTLRGKKLKENTFNGRVLQLGQEGACESLWDCDWTRTSICSRGAQSLHFGPLVCICMIKAGPSLADAGPSASRAPLGPFTIEFWGVGGCTAQRTALVQSMSVYMK